jgi:7-carboxy-7-deazaguanine synthase
MDRKLKSLEVTEIFGPTIQGEGPSMGRRAVFLRLRRCNLACTWCDTRYTWDKEDPGYNSYETLRVEDVLDRLIALSPDVPPLLVITGGEPLLWQLSLKALLRVWVIGWEYEAEIETAGTIPPDSLGAYKSSHFNFNISPKLVHSGNVGRVTEREDVLQDFADLHNARFKFVVQTEGDLGEVDAFRQRYQIPNRRIWIMPEGKTPEGLAAKSRVIAEAAIAHGYNYSPRLHISLWGDERGR